MASFDVLADSFTSISIVKFEYSHPRVKLSCPDVTGKKMVFTKVKIDTMARNQVSKISLESEVCGVKWRHFYNCKNIWQVDHSRQNEAGAFLSLC